MFVGFLQCLIKKKLANMLLKFETRKSINHHSNKKEEKLGNQVEDASQVIFLDLVLNVSGGLRAAICHSLTCLGMRSIWF